MSAPSRSTSTILLVDDEPDILGFMEMALREEGYTVVSASSGLDALKVVEEQPPDLILLDAKMPLMDGRQFMVALRSSKENHVPVVLMTAARIPPDEIAGIGAQGYLAKPFDLDDLLDCVARFLPAEPES